MLAQLWSGRQYASDNIYKTDMTGLLRETNMELKLMAKTNYYGLYETCSRAEILDDDCGVGNDDAHDSFRMFL